MRLNLIGFSQKLLAKARFFLPSVPTAKAVGNSKIFHYTALGRQLDLKHGDRKASDSRSPFSFLHASRRLTLAAACPYPRSRTSDSRPKRLEDFSDHHHLQRGRAYTRRLRVSRVGRRGSGR